MNRQSGFKQHRVKEFEDRCRARGLPVTWQRRAILEALLDREDHPTPDQLYDDLHPRLPGLSRATVYRVLETLVGLGLAARASHPGSAARFDAVTGAHHHLLCLHCHQLVDLSPDLLPELPLPEGNPLGFDVRDMTVTLRGLCPRCRSTRSDAAGAKPHRRRRGKETRHDR